jgi:D-sedoheptulose 7-phosphate isomerase
MLSKKKVRSVFDRLFQRYPELGICREELPAAYQALAQTFEAGGTLFLCGNGGSFADCVHIKGELAKSFVAKRPITDKVVLAKLQSSEMGRRLADAMEMGFAVVVLGESHSLRSAYENDRDPVLHYAQELNAFASSTAPGIFMGISTSGHAKNVLAAMTLAQAYGMTTISFTGTDGGPLAQWADIKLKTPGESTSDIQENQLPIYHALCLMIEANFFG